ncbi:3-methylfumaryl-CoA hydratase [Streptomyces aurantiacus]|uniref:FAS1-like dehydratase domain-containing protein n=1 Tax=Streptomyces aurantiacus TaxID=47760 RepID=UPI00278F9413|nr:MaoC family dehydratase N-terminal domain-containing protein [Streptomyces aurantiacus]MDQ0779255.1 3-methylfumaryl-CoA hydratase [Streptomyces aurantiacus]
MEEVAERSELLLPGPAHALGGLLDVPVPDLDNGEALPLLWHWLYLLERPAQIDLGSDGHPVRGTVPAPPGPGRRRMWAGGRVESRGPLRCGQVATRRTKVLSVREKRGRSGPLTFVVVSHQVMQNGRVVIDEEQDIVYREAVAASSVRTDPTPAADARVPAADDEWEIAVSPTLLFRFSALTYNGHRIHYDRDYARDVEGYPGLVTHGPLQALAMAEAARGRSEGRDQRFEYRLLSPLFDHQGMVVEAVRGPEGTTTAVRDVHGRQTAAGRLHSP